MNYQEQIDNLELQRQVVLAKMAPLSKEITRLYEEIQSLRLQQAEQKKASGFSDEDLMLYRPENDNTVYYNAATALAEEYGMKQGGYIRTSEKNGAYSRCFEVAFHVKESHPKEWPVSKQIERVVDFLDRAKSTLHPVENEFYLGVFEHTLSEHGVYHIGVSIDLKTATLYKTTYGHKSEKKKGTLKEVLEYTAKHHYYE